MTATRHTASSTQPCRSSQPAAEESTASNARQRLQCACKAAMDLKKSGSFTCGGDAKVAPADSSTSTNERQSPQRLRQRANTHENLRGGAESSRAGGSEELDWSRTRSG
eukprot:3304251-Prymnesium_polylepis.1